MQAGGGSEADADAAKGKAGRAFAVLWLGDLVDGEETSVQLPVFTAENPRRLTQNALTAGRTSSSSSGAGPNSNSTPTPASASASASTPLSSRTPSTDEPRTSKTSCGASWAGAASPSRPTTS